MRIGADTEVDREKIVHDALEYALQTTYSDQVLINQGHRPLRGEILDGFISQTEDAIQFVGRS